MQGNFIGVDATGTNAIPNARGLYLRAAFAHQIGGTHPADRNLVSGSDTAIGGFDGQNVLAPFPPTHIEGNYIGTDRSGARALAGQGLGQTAGIGIAAPDQIIGGLQPGAGNIIAFNAGAGVYLTVGRATHQIIEGNSIYANGHGGIIGSTPGPIITSAIPGSTTVQGVLNGSPGVSYRVEVFANQTCDPSGSGQGQTFLGAVTAAVAPSGTGEFSVALTQALAAGTILTATASPDNEGLGTTGFSRCTEVGAPLDLALTVSGPNGRVAGLTNTTFTVAVLNNSTQMASDVVVTAILPKTLTFISASPGWTNISGTITALFPTLGPGATVTGTITVLPKLVGNQTISVQVEAQQPDANQANNQAQLSFLVVNPAPRQIVVTNISASGPGSFTQAITDANKGVGGDTIAFHLAGSGVHRFPDSYYGGINVPVTIDGYTQPGAKPNSLANGDDAVVLIQFDEAALILNSGSSTVRGLSLPSVQFLGTPSGPGGSNVVEGCFIGLDATGRSVLTNADGITSSGIKIDGADDTRVGGSTPAQRNVIAATYPQSISYESAAAIRTDAARTVVQGNYIGTDATGLVQFGNAGAGVAFGSGPFGDGPVNGGLVGGPNPGEGNLIASNAGPGVLVTDPHSGVSILGNSIFGNAAIGISLGQLRARYTDPPFLAGTDGVASAPVITNVTHTATGTRADGYLQGLTNETYRLEFFSSPPNSNSFFQSEGKIFLSAHSFQSDSNGRLLFSVSLPPNSELISATATESAGQTSAFSTYYQAQTSCLQPSDVLVGFTLSTRVEGNLTTIQYVQRRSHDLSPDGLLYERSFTTGSERIRDLAVRGNEVWVVDAAIARISRLGACGEQLAPFLQFTNEIPSAISFDANGNIYIGFYSTNQNVRKFDAGGHLLDQYTVLADNNKTGVTDMDLAADQHTLLYAATGRTIHRYDLAGHQQLANFATNTFGAGSLRILPDGGVVTTDQGYTLRRFDSVGTGVWTNRTGPDYSWQGVRLDPDQKTFWAIDLQGNLGHFDLLTGSALQIRRIEGPTGAGARALALAGEPTAAGGQSATGPGPRLLASLSGPQLNLSWSATSAGFSLQSSPALGSSADWKPVTGTPVLANGQYTISVSPSEHARFYRLAKP